jgi:hypothetical protein
VRPVLFGRVLPLQTIADDVHDPLTARLSSTRGVL